MHKSISCLSCGQKTQLIIKSVGTKHKEFTLLLKNAPVYYCTKCDDTTIPFEVLTLFRYIKTLRLKPGVNEFEFEAMYKKMGQATNGRTKASS